MSDEVIISDDRINESSALAYSALYPHIVYTLNDENDAIFAVDTRTGEVVGTFTLRLKDGTRVVLKDPEALAIRADGSLWIADIGDNDRNRTDATLYVLREPGPGNHGALVCEKYPIAYPNGARNAEALLINPLSQNRYIISKEAIGNLYRSDVGSLEQGRKNTLRWVGTRLPAYVTDACFSVDGRFVFVRQKDKPGTVRVLDGDWWRFVDEFDVDEVDQPESITADPDGIHIWIGSEGENSPLIRVLLPERFRKPGVPVPEPEPEPEPQPASSGIDLSIWKWTAPVGEPEDPLEVYPVADNYQYPPWLVRHADRSCTFRANCGGVTTEGSDYARSELREMTPDGDEADWSNASGTHILRGRFAITHLPDVKRHAVCAQIHDDKSKVIMVRREGNHLFVESPYSEDLTLDADYTGEAFDLEIVADSKGIRVTYNGTHTVTIAGLILSGMYFKAGCYTQSNTAKGDSADAYGEVTIYDLEVEHVR